MDGVETLEQFKEKKADDLKAQKEKSAEDAFVNALIEKVCENATVEIPEVMKHPLYENLKDSRVCKATLFVNYTPDKEKENIEEINIRFQKVLTSPDDENNRSLYVSVSGLDVENMVGEGIKLFQKYHKK